MQSKTFPFLCVVISMLLLVSCNNDTECRQQADIYLNVVFEGDSLRLLPDSVNYEHVKYTRLNNVSIQGVGRDSIIYEHAALDKMRLPLRPDTTITEYLLTIDGNEGVLTIYHDNQPNFVSLACGCFVFHTLESTACTTACVDSVVVLNTQVTTASDNHLRIYTHK